MTDDPPHHNGQLSRREREIAQNYAEGASYKEIGVRLFIAPTTVRTHISAIYRKLGVSSKIELLRALEGAAVAEPAAPSGEQGARAAPPAKLDTDGAAVGDLSGFLRCPAVAVLPFDNLSGDRKQDFFSNGMTEDVITALSYWRHFPVIARNSTAAARARGATVVEIGQALGARYVVEGSVQRAGSRIRLSAHLIDAETGHTIWSRRFDRELGDLFDIQDELALEIVTAIEPRISRAEQNRARRRSQDDLDAWERSQRALWHITQGTSTDYAEARRLLEEAMRTAPTSAYPRSLLAFCSFYQALFGWTKDPAAAFVSVAQAAEEAVSLDDSDWLAQALLGIAKLWTARRYDLAKEALDRSLSLNPSAPLAHHFNGCTRGFTGDFAEALASQEAVLRLDPAYPFASVILADMALIHLLTGELDEAEAYARKALDSQPNNTRAIQRLVSALGLAGRRAEAEHWRECLLRLQPDVSMRYFETTYPFQNDVHRKRFLHGLALAGWDGLSDSNIMRASAAAQYRQGVDGG